MNLIVDIDVTSFSNCSRNGAMATYFVVKLSTPSLIITRQYSAWYWVATLWSSVKKSQCHCKY